MDATIHLDASQAIVYKNTDYPLSFSITRGILFNYTKNYKMSNNGTLGEGNYYSQTVDKTKWINIELLSTFTDDSELYLSITGDYKLGYKYKVYIQESQSIIKDYDMDFIYDDEKEINVVIPHELIKTALNPYHIVISVLQEDNTEVTISKPILLADIAPTAFVIVQGRTVYAQLGDVDEGDLVRYNIYLNGEKLFPLSSEFSEFIPPTTIVYELPREKVHIGVLNHVVVNVEDNWGLGSQGTNDFIGIYTGLMFCDENENFYSTDIGEVIEYLDMGILQAGKLSDIQTVFIKNTYGYDVRDIVITVENVPPLNTVLLDSSLEDFVGHNTITIYGVLRHNEKIPFYFRILPDFESVGGGIFDIIAQATPVS